MNSRNIKAVFIMAIMLLNLGAFFGSTAYASESTAEVSLDVVQTFEIENAGSEKVELLGTYELSALSEEAPMPDGNKVYRFSIDGSDKTHVIELAYTHAGVYKYSLKQTTQHAENYFYDKTNYIITVYVKNTADGKLVPEVVAESGSGKKSSSISFKNLYKGKDTVQPENGGSVKTSDEHNVFFWLFLTVASSAALFLLLFKMIAFARHS